MATCSSCGEENPPRARFCLGCGLALAEDAPAGGIRKTVTLLFADVTGSTGLGERLDPEALRGMMNRYFQEMRVILERHGGTVEKFIGDAVMAVFGIPVVHEDDAVRAVRAAAAMRDGLGRLNEGFERERGVGIQVRIGVNTGEVVAGDSSQGQAFATGDAVNVAARLEQAAAPGEVLIGDTTRRLVADAVRVEPLEPLALKGKSVPSAAWRLLEVLPDVPAFTREISTPFIGRRHELETLLEALDRASTDRLCVLCTVVGPPGIGKSRLVREFVAAAGGRARVVIGSCLPYGERITFAPLADIVRQLGGTRPEAGLSELLAGEEWSALAVDRIVGALGLASAKGQPEEAFWAFRKLFETLGKSKPVVAVVDDIHWAESMLIDLLEYLVSFVTDTPMLLLCLTRPDLFEDRPSWAAPRENASILSLAQLSEEEAGTLVDGVAGDQGLAESVRTEILDASEGNPLFVEQMLALRAVESESQRAAVPPTIDALLAARIDRLPSDERAVIERASIEGRGFHRGAVAALLPPSASARLDALLTSLIRKQFVRPDQTRFDGDDGFRFVHALVRDAAYQSISKQLRAELHERFASWLERAAAERLGEYEEIVGYHLEAAYCYRSELGPVDEEGRRLARGAAKRLAGAGQRAAARRDVRGAEGLLTRACDLYEENDPGRLVALADLADALLDAGNLVHGEAVLEEVIARADESGNALLAAHARLRSVHAGVHTDRTDPRDLLREAEAAVQQFNSLNDDRALALAWALVGRARFWLGSARDSEEAYKHAVAIARAAGDLRRETEALAWWIGAVAHGPTPVSEGIAFCDEVLRRGLKDPLLDIFALEKRGLLEAMSGRFEDARGSVSEAKRIADEFALRVRQGINAQYVGQVELLAGDLESAEHELRPGYELLGSLGESAFRASVGEYLAEVLYQQGRYVEAADVLEVEAPEIDALRGKIKARMGDIEEAERLARRGVEELETGDYLDARAKASMDLGEVLRLAGRPREAADALADAVRLHEEKGNIVSAETARGLLREVAPLPR